MKPKPALVWDHWNQRHIKKHHVTPKEVEEAYQTHTLTLPSYAQKTLVLSQTKQARLLALVISTKKQANPYVVSARDMNPKERKYFYDQTKAN